MSSRLISQRNPINNFYYTALKYVYYSAVYIIGKTSTQKMSILYIFHMDYKPFFVLFRG